MGGQCSLDQLQVSTDRPELPELLEYLEGTDTQLAVTMLACVAMGTATARAESDLMYHKRLEAGENEQDMKPDHRSLTESFLTSEKKGKCRSLNMKGREEE